VINQLKTGRKITQTLKKEGKYSKSIFIFTVKP